jgi:hypothetical protein
MTDHRSPPPQAEACLLARYPSSQKGGTIIIEHVCSLEEHERLLNSGSYRLDACPRCGATTHLHDLRPRVMVAGAGLERVGSSTLTQRVRCADRKDCGAAWQLLPAFLARHLWRCWSTVERAMFGGRAEQPKPQPGGETRSRVVPERTARRWRGRLVSSAALLVAVLGTAEQPELTELAGAVGLEGTRSGFVVQYTARFQPPARQRLAQVAALLHRLAPGVRLM